MLDFLEDMQQSKSGNSTPLLVHCRYCVRCNARRLNGGSAGIGRTGVYIMLELGLAHFQTRASVDMPAMLAQLRSQRMGMVQTEVCHAPPANQPAAHRPAATVQVCVLHAGPRAPRRGAALPRPSVAPASALAWC